MNAPKQSPPPRPVTLAPTVNPELVSLVTLIVFSWMFTCWALAGIVVMTVRASAAIRAMICFMSLSFASDGRGVTQVGPLQGPQCAHGARLGPLRTSLRLSPGSSGLPLGGALIIRRLRRHLPPEPPTCRSPSRWYSCRASLLAV